MDNNEEIFNVISENMKNKYEKEIKFLEQFGGFAYPDGDQHKGMTLLDHFAIETFKMLIADKERKFNSASKSGMKNNYKKEIESSWTLAEWMIEERNKRLEIFKKS